MDFDIKPFKSHFIEVIYPFLETYVTKITKHV